MKRMRERRLGHVGIDNQEVQPISKEDMRTAMKRMEWKGRCLR